MAAYTKRSQQSYSFYKSNIYKGRSADYNLPTWYYTSYLSTLDGVTNSNWRADIKAGRSATTYLNGVEKAILQYTPGSWTLVYRETIWPNWYTEQYYQTGFIYSYPSSVLTWPVATSFSTVSADNIAKAKLVKYARAAQTSFTAGVSGGEIRETLRFIRSPLRGLFTSLDSYMKLVKKRARERRYVKRRGLDKKVRENLLNRMVAGTWLESQMAILPLMGEVKSGAEALARVLVNVEREHVQIRAKGKAEYYEKSLNPSGGWTYFKRDLAETKYTAEVMYRGAVRVRIPEKARALSAAEKFGLMPKDFLPTIWELIPGSFLLDYVANVDDLISAATYAISNFAWLNRTVRRSAERSIIQLYDQTGDIASRKLTTPGEYVISSSFSTPRLVLLDKRIERSVYTGSLVPDFTLNIPASPRKWANIAALLLVQKRTIEALR